MSTEPRTLNPLAKSSVEKRGAVYTRPEVVNFILDLVNYTPDQPLHNFRLLEPSFGMGDFLLLVVKRLLAAYQNYALDMSNIVTDLSNAIRAVEVHIETIGIIKLKLITLLQKNGVSKEQAYQLLDFWIVDGDFLLVDLPHKFTHVVGNPPYVRQELIPNALMAEYRKRYETIYDRADLYIPFIERCLVNLEPGGTLGFICADRWMKNKYGAPLRAMIAENYHLVSYIDMVDTPAFLSNVIAYPAITAISKNKPGITKIAHRPQINNESLSKLARSMRNYPASQDSRITEVPNIAKGREPWILKCFDQLAVVRRLEAEFPLLEESGCKIGIGVATGADKIFISNFNDLDVESSRKLPLVTTKDINRGIIEWKGLGVINPFCDDGTLVNLEDYPKLSQYIYKHAGIIRKRNCAKRNPKNWYRTIDRIDSSLTSCPKLLIPDIKGEAQIVHEDGFLYPHHNLYYITSCDWDLKALQAILLSGIAKLFVSIYSPQMRGGYLRFQAQYLRRIRLPRWEDIPRDIRIALSNGINNVNIESCNNAVFDLYRFNHEERAAVMSIITG